MTAKDFYSKKALKHQLGRAIKKDVKYFNDCIIELIDEYHSLKMKELNDQNTKV